MAKLIDADRLEKLIYESRSTYCLKEDVIAAIAKQPTVDAAEVVRCWECKKHSEVDGKHYCKFWRMYCPDDSDFFCKAGERKGGDGNG